MSIILNIDTAIEIASISIAKNGEMIEEISNAEQKEHGGFLQTTIQKLLKNTSLSIKELDAVAVSAGPGSYTGLRVGIASAKGLCYALNKPLITIGTLKIAALAAILETNKESLSDSPLFCPMIDARRMEVFTALYNRNLEPLLGPCAMVLDQSSFAKMLLKNKIIFFGNGSKKWRLLCNDENARFITTLSNSLAMSKLAYKKYEFRQFADIAYSEPFYLKDFFTSLPS